MDGGKLEWGSGGLAALFAQRRNLGSPSFLAMLRDVVRFGREAPQALRPEAAARYASATLRDFLAEKRYSPAFVRHYVLPMCAAVWSVPAAAVMDFPLLRLLRFWANHHLLDIFQRPRWRVVKGRSRTYVDRILAELPDVRTSCPVTSVTPAAAPGGPVVVIAAGGREEEYDSVLLATHADVSLRLLGGAGAGARLPAAAAVLAAVPYAENDVWLHSDPALMPRARATWSAWNCLARSAPGADRDAVCVSYWVNRLQALPPGAPDLFVTLNPPSPPAAGTVFRHLTLAHPVFSFEASAAQAALPSVQGGGGVFYAGAWAGDGFHEDGLRAAVAAVEAMGKLGIAPGA